jgi:hypothetical protein
VGGRLGRGHIPDGKGAAENMPGQFIQPNSISVHSRKPAFICVKMVSFATLPANDRQTGVSARSRQAFGHVPGVCLARHPHKRKMPELRERRQTSG